VERHRIERVPVKRDISIAVIAVVLILGVSFALAKTRPDKPLSPSAPFTAASASGGGEKKIAPGDKIVMHVNGEPITESEFKAFLLAVPEQQQPMLAAPEGRRILADEIVRMKALEQEGRRLGVSTDPELVAQFELLRSQIIAQRALEKIVKEKAESRIREEYEKEKGNSKTLRHILISYDGSMIPARDHKPRTADAAMSKANALVAQLRSGGDFGAIAKAESDDVDSGSRGGTLGPLTGGQLPPEIEGVVQKLQPGQVSDPLRTQYGVHIFSIGSPSLDDLRPMLMQRVQQQVVQDEVKSLAAKAKVELDPTYFPPSPQPRAPMPVVPRSNG